MKPRWYQSKSAIVTIKRVEEDSSCHPVIAAPTGSGKSLILCLLAAKYLDAHIEKDVLILSHRYTILQQDYKTLSNYFHGMEIGLYSAKLESRTVKKITVAGIASVFRKPELFENVGLIIIDEAHLVNNRQMGMYRSLLEALSDTSCVGLTATPFRTGQGYIYEGKESIFTECSFDITSTKNYNKLVEQGYLSKMFSLQTKLNLDTKDIPKRKSEFIKKNLSISFDQQEITEAACVEVAVVFNRRKLNRALVFAIDIQHADHITEELIANGINAVAIHSKTKLNLTQLKRFKRGEYDVAVGVDMLTTGLDVPEIDLIVLLRPTDSVSSHVQMLGRGGRPLYLPGYDITKKSQRLEAIRKGKKPFCVVMDFSGNIERLGPINNVYVEPAKGKGRAGEAIMKTCPKCKFRNYGAVRKCIQCGNPFVFKTRLKSGSGSGSVIKNEMINENPIASQNISGTETPINNPNIDGEWEKIEHIRYDIHGSKGGRMSLKVNYICKTRTFAEYICIDHGGYPSIAAKKWVKKRMDTMSMVPRNLSQLYDITKTLKKPTHVLIVEDGKWTKIKDHYFPASALY